MPLGSIDRPQIGTPARDNLPLPLIPARRTVYYGNHANSADVVYKKLNLTGTWLLTAQNLLGTCVQSVAALLTRLVKFGSLVDFGAAYLM